MNITFSGSCVDLESELTLAVCTSGSWWHARVPLHNGSCNCGAFGVLAEHDAVMDLPCGLTFRRLLASEPSHG